MDDYGALLSLPVSSLLADDARVCVWATHDPSIQAFVKDKLLLAWGCEAMDEVVWLKVCATGEPVYPLFPREGAGVDRRRSYEILYVGYRGAAGRAKVDCIVSAPLRHSWKPGVEGIFEGDCRAGLELFARELRAGWTSAGDEVLKFMEVGAFVTRIE